MSDLSDRIGVILNPNAGMFRTKKGRKEFYRLTGRMGIPGHLKRKYGKRIVLHAEEKAEAVQYACDKFIDEKVCLIISMGGDGTQGNIHTNMAKRKWLRRKKGLEENCKKTDKKTNKETGKKSNNRHMLRFLKALNTEKGDKLPYFYNVKGGTVHVCSSMLGFTDNLELAIDNALRAIDKGRGMTSFRRVYVPTIIGYSAEEPDNPARMEVMFQYADGGVRRFFDEYYKDKGPGKPNMKTAYWIITKAIISLPAIPLPFIPSWPEGFVYKLSRKTPCRVRVDGKELPMKEKRLLFASTINGNLYGLKPFRKARKHFNEFERHYNAGEDENFDKDTVERQFHILTGDFTPWRIVPALPRVLREKAPNIKGLYDLLAKEVIIEEDDDIKYIADGTRKTEGKKLILSSGFEIGMPYLHETPLLK